MLSWLLVPYLRRKGTSSESAICSSGSGSSLAIPLLFQDSVIPSVKWDASITLLRGLTGGLHVVLTRDQLRTPP